MRALEIVDDCDFLVVLYQGKENTQVGTGFVQCGETTLAELNWYVDRFKLWLHGPLRG